VNSIQSGRIYLDYAATTPLRREAADAMCQALGRPSYNPSSLHAEGREARRLLDDARDRVARALGAARKEITFTGSGTEADNLAVTGGVRAAGRKGHVVATAIEHHAVLHALDALAGEGYEITLVAVDSNGIVDPASFAAAIRDDTILASVMYANNEIGTIEPIAELAAIARGRGVLFHTDAIQAPGWLPVSVKELGIDLMSISAHKFFGPRGAGVLYVRDGVPVSPIVHGGGQEFGRRSGTENLAAITGMVTALELAVAERPAKGKAVAALRDRLESGIRAVVGGVSVNGAGAARLPHVSSVTFKGVESDALLMRLDLAGIAVSSGSACTSGALVASHVIEALGTQSGRRAGVLRFSLSGETTAGEIDRVLDVLPGIVGELRERAMPLEGKQA
jgi:cysteine desulfurase